MTVTTVPYLRLTDGTTTLNLLDGTNYALERGTWAPRVARRSRSTLGGRPYAPVVEEIPLIVRGSTAATALANLAALSALLEQAEAWYNDESATPVRITFQPHGSTLATPLESLVFGGTSDAGNEMVTLPADFNDVGMLFEITGVVLRFVRDGAWYGPVVTEDGPGGGGFVEQPTVVSATFDDVDALSPVAVRVGAFPDNTSISSYDSGFLLIARDDDRLTVLDATDLAAGAFTTSADAARKPEGTGVLVYTPVGTTEASTFHAMLIDGGRRIGVVAALRNTSASTVFTVRVGIQGPSARTTGTTTPYIVDTSTTDPRVVFLGVALCEDISYTGITLYVTADTAADTLVFDYFALIVLDDPTSRILAHGPIDAQQTITIGADTQLQVDPRELTARSPQVLFGESPLSVTDYTYPEWWRGDGFLLSQGTTIAAVYCGRNAVGGYWRLWDTTANLPVQHSVTFDRRPAYLVPV